ncbi:MAG: sensor histidine kinase N-terminal domain-containing protein [Hahellaceae bacterium]|nr:sensor histidine kinase N-terminal domain-containing protein [Hahellaceae bacterium]
MLTIRSLKHYFLISLLTVIMLINLIIGVSNYHESEEQVEELFDAEMAQMARVLQSLFTHGQRAQGHLEYHEKDIGAQIDNGHDEYTNLGHKYEKKLAFQIRSPEGAIILQSDSATRSPLPIQAIGYHSLTLEKDAWRTFTLIDSDSGYVIQVAQNEDVRSELTHEIALHSVIPTVLSLPVFALLIGALVSRATRHLEHISNEVKQRDAGNLEAIDLPNVPDEIAPIIAALNHLFMRVRLQSERERRFTADAAHELRTPLAAIKIQLQNALRKSQLEASHASVSKALKALDRLVELVQQLLLLSRLDQPEESLGIECVELGDVVSNVVSELYPIAQARHIDFHLDLSDKLSIQANPVLIFTLVRNFAENALRYSDAHQQIDIRVNQHQVVIRDFGPGIPDDKINQVFERFYRVEGDHGGGGAGLGLAICKEISGRYHIDVSLRNASPGLEVTLDFEPSETA